MAGKFVFFFSHKIEKASDILDCKQRDGRRNHEFDVQAHMLIATRTGKRVYICESLNFSTVQRSKIKSWTSRAGVYSVVRFSEEATVGIAFYHRVTSEARLTQLHHFGEQQAMQCSKRAFQTAHSDRSRKKELSAQPDREQVVRPRALDCIGSVANSSRGPTDA